MKQKENICLIKTKNELNSRTFGRDITNCANHPPNHNNNNNKLQVLFKFYFNSLVIPPLPLNNKNLR